MHAALGGFDSFLPPSALFNLQLSSLSGSRQQIGDDDDDEARCVFFCRRAGFCFLQ